jgi:quinol monooxygenase YgiN
MLVLHSKYPFDPDRRERALELVEEMVSESRAEEGILGYDAAVEVGNPDVVHFFDRYEDAAALEAHGERDHVQRFAAELPDLLAAEPEITRFVVESASDLDPGVDLDD